jgi:hypothetical protein
LATEVSTVEQLRLRGVWLMGPGPARKHTCDVLQQDVFALLELQHFCALLPVAFQDVHHPLADA